MRRRCSTPATTARRGKPGRRRRPRSEELHELAARADELGEMLGEEHDLAMLAERVRGRGAGRAAGAPAGARAGSCWS